MPNINGFELASIIQENTIKSIIVFCSKYDNLVFESFKYNTCFFVRKKKLVNIKKAFNKKVLFEKLSLTINSNALTCIYGESGCGKTTILNIIGFIEKYDSGKVLYDGKEIKKQSDIKQMHRDKIGFVFQNFGLIDNYTVKNNLNLIHKINKDKHKDALISEALEKIGLKGCENRLVYELSGGEQQRVAIAKILLMMERQLLLFRMIKIY